MFQRPTVITPDQLAKAAAAGVTLAQESQTPIAAPSDPGVSFAVSPILMGFFPMDP